MMRDFSFGIIPMIRTDRGVELLLIQHQEGHWAFPKGHAEGNETPLETAKRELQEETGIAEFEVDENTTLTEQYDVIKNDMRMSKTVTYYPALVGSQEVIPQEKEIRDFGWFTFNEAVKRVTFSVTKQLLAEFKEYYDALNAESAA